MCGIAGAIAMDRQAAVTAMVDALRHRGPDGDGFFQDDVIALGQCRLSIIDLANGRQPIANEDGTIQLVCNGEIYNSPELRRELITAGHRFRTGTDVEVILHLYEEHGRDCVRYLRGMFAFAVWDGRARSLLLARDHLGQKPLYYAATGDRLLFASEVKAILATGLVEPAIDLDALWHYVSLRFIPDDRSLFRGIRKLPAATTLLWRNGGSTVEKYWSVSFVNKLPGSEERIVGELDNLLRETVRMHLLSDVRVGAFLSGGIDSSIVSAIMATSVDQPVPSFSIGVKEDDFNELPYARLVAERYGMAANERVVSADLIHLLPTMVRHLDEPSDPFGVGVFLVSREASKAVKVVLGGDGGDENFAGYDRYAGQRLVEFYAVLPAWLRKHVLKRLIDHVPESFTYKSLAQKLRWMNRMSFYSDGERYAESMSFHRFGWHDRDRLFTPAAQRRVEDRGSLRKILTHFDADNVEHLVDRMLYTDLMTRIPDHLLMIVDRMTMAHSLECRSPLLDHKVVEFAAATPAELKLKGTKLKYILRRVAAKYLPDELVNRPKQGFGFPLGVWMRKDLRCLLKNLFRESRFAQLGMFDGDYMRTLADEHLAGGVDHSFRLWILLNLEVWHRLYFENQTVDAVRSEIDRLMRPA